MKRHLLVLAAACAVVIASAVVAIATAAEAPRVYAITGARIVTAAGPVLETGTVVVRGALIESVGPSVAAPPDAVTIDGKGLTIYPGLIDMGTAVALEAPPAEAARDVRTRMEAERARRHTLLRAQLEAASVLKPDAPELERFAAAGITSVLVTPPGDGIRGRSALVNVAAGEDPPQIGQVANERAAMFVVRAPVALHVSFPPSEGGDSYPASLMGAVAFVRQAFLDAGAANGPYDPGLAALKPALAGAMPVAFDAGNRVEIRRALSLARELRLQPIVVGGIGADQATNDLEAAGASVIYSLDYPVRPRNLAPEAEEPIRVLRERANAPKVPAALHRAGIPFAFASEGLREPADFVRNAGKAVRAGLPADAAIRALTIGAAKLAGVSSALGSIEKGKRANLVVTEGDLFDDKASVRHVFVDGRLLTISKQGS